MIEPKEPSILEPEAVEQSSAGEQGPLQVRLLGAIEAVDESGEPIELGPEKCRAVFAALALSVGEAVPVGRLIDLVWGADPPRTADKTLQSYVTRLRKGLGADVIVRVGAAYRLQLPPEAVDVSRFQKLLDKNDVTGAIGEWRGTPLAGLEDGGFQAIVDGLTEQWLGAVESELTTQVDDDAAGAIGRLTELTAAHPFREGLLALLMTALYRVGRQADALAVYRKARDHLVEQLGVEPGPRLRALEGSILDQDDRLTSVTTNAAGGGPGATKSKPPSGTVTIALADVMGSAELWETDRGGLKTAMASLDQLVRKCADRHDGYLFAATGESFGLAFHRPSQAGAWSEELQAAAAGGGLGDGSARLRLCIGLNTGETEDRGPGYFGPAVNIAAGLASVGHGGQTLVSAATAALLGGGPELHELGTFRLDGVISDQRIVQLGGGNHPPLRTEAARQGNLGRQLGPLLGRDDELQAIAAALVESPVLTLIGPGGIGKTRLALAAARAAQDGLADGAWFVELAGIAASVDVARAVADVMTIRENPSLGLIGSIVASLKSAKRLIVLDNCEHVIDGAAELASAIADACPDVRVLATSREGLGVAGERLMVVSPLEPSGPGVELFVQRAKAVTPDFDVTTDHDLVVEICRRLDGVPLAIELAAARTKTLSPADLIDRLDNRLRLLSGGRRTSVERHRTLRATVQWSYDLLAPADQLLFRRLSVFAGPFDLNAAAQVAMDREASDEAGATGGRALLLPPDLDIGELLGALVDRSMLIVESGTFGRRFRLLETMRQFGAERLTDEGETDLIAERHARWCVEQVGEIHHAMDGVDEVMAVTRLGELWPNLRAAFDWACTVEDRLLAYELVKPIAPEILLRAQTEIGEWVERMLDVPVHGSSDGPPDEEMVAFGLLWAAHRYTISQDHESYERLVERHGKPDHPWVHYGRAFLYEDPDGLATWGGPAAEVATAAGERYLAALMELGGTGQSLISQGRFDELEVFAAPLLHRYRADGPPTMLSFVLAMLGYSSLLQGREADAERLFNEAAEIDTPDRTLGLDTAVQARAAMLRGHPELALAHLLRHVEHLLDTGNMYMTRMAAVDFINIMTVLDRAAAAGPVRGYLARPDLLDIELSRSLVRPEAEAVPLTDQDRARGQALDSRTTLEYIRTVISGAS